MTLRAARMPDCEPPVLSVAIPAYGNWDYLRVSLESVINQTARDFEIVVSEDAASDDRTADVVAQLEGSGLAYQVHRQDQNLGYDGNVRFCLAASRGRHVLLLGHDDALASPGDIDYLQTLLAQLGHPEVAFTDVEDWATGVRMNRAATTGILGAGVEVAIAHFRTFSFVGGLIYERAAAARHDTDRWDRSIFVQIYLACRIIAAGGRLASIARPCVRKDIRIEDRTVVNYATELARQQRSLVARRTGMESVVRVTLAAIEPGLTARTDEERSHATRRVATDVLLYSYLFWLFEYRRVGGLKAAIGVARTSTPRHLLGDAVLTPLDRARVGVLYGAMTTVGVLMPGDRVLGVTRRLANKLRRRRQVAVA